MKAERKICSLWGIPTDAQSLEVAVNRLAGWARGDQPRYVCCCTVYTLMKALEDERVHHALTDADMVTADGMPIVWMQRRQGFEAERAYGPDVMLGVCGRTANDRPEDTLDKGAQPCAPTETPFDVRHYFLGGMPGVAERLAERLTARFPGLQVAGTFSPPVEEVGAQADTALAERLNASGADVIWVGLGSPKQDVWMALYRPHLTARLLVGVGAAFDFLSGSKRQAPRVMRQAGLEWLWRLGQEPRRLWRRYLIYNTRFVWYVLRDGWKEGMRD